MIVSSSQNRLATEAVLASLFCRFRPRSLFTGIIKTNPLLCTKGLLWKIISNIRYSYTLPRLVRFLWRGKTSKHMIYRRLIETAAILQYSLVSLLVFPWEKKYSIGVDAETFPFLWQEQAKIERRKESNEERGGTRCGQCHDDYSIARECFTHETLYLKRWPACGVQPVVHIVFMPSPVNNDNFTVFKERLVLESNPLGAGHEDWIPSLPDPSLHRTTRKPVRTFVTALASLTSTPKFPGSMSFLFLFLFF